MVTPSSGFESVQGRRWTMEDTHVLMDDINGPFSLSTDRKRAYYAVYDGHGGKNAADITAELLHKNIIEDPAFRGGDYDTAITNGFAKTDAHILKCSTAEKWTNGTTTVVCMLVDNTLIIANTGDSEAVLAKREGGAGGDDDARPLSSICLTEKHKPTEPAERKRVEDAGGQVIFGRVLGSLAVSKAMGDIDFKHPYNKGQADFVSAVPYIQRVDISRDNPFLVIACDGLWDKLTYQDAVDYVIKCKRAGKTPTETAKLIVAHSLDLGTFDNVTTIIVYFDWDASGNASISINGGSSKGEDGKQDGKKEEPRT